MPDRPTYKIPVSPDLSTATPAGAPVKTRYTDPLALRSTYDWLTDEDAPESRRRSKIMRVYEGNLPYSPADLEAGCFKHLTNVNWLGLKGVIDNRAAAIDKLRGDTANMVDLQPLSREMAGPDSERIARVVAEEFSTMLRENDAVAPALSLMVTESDLYGLGPITWESSLDYRPVALNRGQIRFIPDAPVQSSRQELVMFESTIQAGYLFSLLDSPEVAASEGWDVAQVRKWIVEAFSNGVETRAQPGTEDHTSVEESAISMMRQNRITESNQFRRLNVIHAFFREVSFPRGITHVIMPATEQKTFLFRKLNAYQTMDQCFLWLPYAINRRNARSVRGLASYLFSIELFSNRYKCRVGDLAFQYASLLFARQGSTSQQQISLTECGPFTILPSDLQATQNNVKPDMNQVMATSQFFDGIGVGSVTGGSKGAIGGAMTKVFAGSERPTKEEVALQQGMASHQEQSLFVHRTSVFDKVFREMYRRTIRLAGMIAAGDPVTTADYPEIAEFMSACAHRGVPVDVLLRSFSEFRVVTCRDLVLGADGKVGVLTELLGNFGGNLDEPGRKNAQHDWVQLRLGVQSAERYAPQVNRDNAPNDQASLATLENNDLQEGQQVMVGTDQLHWSHIPIHSNLLQEIVNTVAAPEDNGAAGSNMEDSIAERTLGNLQQAGKEPKQLLAVLVACSKHVQEHLSIGGMQIGVADKVKQVQRMLKDLRPTIKALNLAVATQERVEQAQREAQEREMQELQEQANENMVRKAQVEADRKAETDRYRIDREHEVAMHKLELEHGRAVAADSVKSGQAANEEARRNAESEAKIDREGKLALARINASNAVARMNAVQQATGAGQVAPSDVAGDLDFTSL